MKDKRKYVRVDICIEVNYKLVSEGRTLLKSNSKNVSGGGMCFLTKKKMGKGSVLELQFRIPDSERREIECKAKVAWQSKENDAYLTGIEFIDLDINEQIFIETFVSKFINELTEYGSS